ncbi:MAG TPA: Crp/Fnr family transcriptional regulator [Wenzhouxiangellaceae bacterium]|nr:Crp/Fnr family transcriptional regulator [Wenzhouxiangellaceae bacterium]
MLERKLVPHEQIRQFDLFSELPDELIEHIRRNAWTISLKAREALFRQNDPVRRSYFCLSGQLKLFRLTRSGSEKIFMIAHAGDGLCDAISLQSERFRPLNATSITESEVLSVDSEVVIDVFHRSQRARTQLVDALIRRVDDLIDHVELLSVDKANFRVASFLFNEYQRNGKKSSFQLNSSKKYIASYLSLQPETLSRCLRTFRQDGIASSTNRDIRIHDPDRLEQLVLGIDAAA